MFREYITSPIDPIPVDYANSLRRLENEPDYALTCLGIAMLRSRIENYNGIAGVYYYFENEHSCVADLSCRVTADANVPMFCYYMYRNESENNIEQELKDLGFEIKENIGAFIKTKADIKCIAAYRKEDNKATIIIKSRDVRLYHMLMSFMSLLYPSLFENKPLTEDDYDLIKALSKTDKDTFVKKVQDIVRPYTMEFRRMMLYNLMKAMHQVKIDQAFKDVESNRANVRSREEAYSNAIAQLKNAIVFYEGIKATESFDEPEEGLVEYLSTQNQIHNLHINGNKLSFSVATLLNNYNSDAWETFSNRGYIFDGEYARDNDRVTLLDAFKKKENRKLLLNNIFNESPEFAVKMAGNYELDLYSCHITTQRGYNYIEADPIFKSYMPNPHLKLYNCLGGYEDRVSRALRQRNYIAAVELCIASAGSVALEETEQTFRPFLGWIMSSREKILRRKDGVDMTPEEALVYLADKGEKE